MKKLDLGQPEIKCELRQDLDTWIAPPKIIIGHCLRLPFAMSSNGARSRSPRVSRVAVDQGAADSSGHTGVKPSTGTVASDSDFKISGTDCFG